MTVDDLMKLDIEFCELVSKKGAEVWANHFLDEGIMITKSGDNIVTEQKIYEVMKPFFEKKGNALTWSPESGGISDDGTLGYTFGKYIRQQMDENGVKNVETGRYTTLWRKLSEGKYKIELDMGN